jgi:serine/threonine protein kinase
MLLTLISLAESDRRRNGTHASVPVAGDGRHAIGHDCENLCQRLVRDPAVRRVIQCLYQTKSAYSVQQNRFRSPSKEWNSIDFKTLVFHRHGTTSIILRTDTTIRKVCALKLIILPYLRFHTIARETREYAMRYSPSGKTHGQNTGSGSNAAKVVEALASSKRWILMDFVEGLTLAEFLAYPGLVDAKLEQPEASISDVLRNCLESETAETLPKAGLTKTKLRFLTLDELLRIDGPLQALPATSDHKRKRGKSEVSLPWMLTIGGALFDAMEDLRAVGQAALSRSPDSATPVSIHGDLTPSNVIVNDVSGISFTLIDLGRNYFYTQSMSGSGELETVFVAPEVREDERLVGLADIYSIGQLLQFIGTYGTLPSEMVADGLYKRTPLVARFLEDLIQAKASLRLRIFASPRVSDGVDYDELKKIFSEEISAVMNADKGRSFASGGLGATLWDIWHPLDGALGRQWALWQERRKDRHYKYRRIGGYTRALFFWSALSLFAAGVAALAVGMWFLRDASWNWSGNVIELLQKIWGGSGSRFPFIDSLRAADYQIPDLHDNWPARLVGISYILAATKNYQNLFSGLMPLLGRERGMAGWQAVAAETFMRMQTVVAPLLVLSTVLIDARLWPIASAIGQTIIFFTNWEIYSFARTSIKKARDLRISTAGAQKTRLPGLISYGEWVPVSLFYAAIVWTMGSLIYVGVLHDIGMYAIGVASINIFVFYIVKCSGVSADDIRIALARAFTLAERVRIINDARRSTADARAYAIGELADRSEISGGSPGDVEQSLA